MSTITLSPEQIAVLEEPVVRDITGSLPEANAQYRRWRNVSEINRIVVHVDDQPRPMSYDVEARYISQAWYHIHRNWQEDPRKPPIYGFGLMYHYKLSFSGGIAQIWRTAPETLVTWNSSSWNRGALAICIDSAASQPALDEILGELHKWLLWQCYRRPEFPAARRDVYGHTEEPSTVKSCPAKYLPWIQRFRRGEW